MSIIADGLGVGYQMFQFLGLAADYSEIILGDNNVMSKMFPGSIIFTYIILSKL